jgi:hypothetical protein
VVNVPRCNLQPPSPKTSPCPRVGTTHHPLTQVTFPSPINKLQWQFHAGVPYLLSATLWYPSPCRATQRTLYVVYASAWRLRWAMYLVCECEREREVGGSGKAMRGVKRSAFPIFRLGSPGVGCEV